MHAAREVVWLDLNLVILELIVRIKASDIPFWLLSEERIRVSIGVYFLHVAF